MTSDDGREALRWTQGQLTTMAAIGEWAALGASVTVWTTRGRLTGRVGCYGSDWLGLYQEAAQVYLPIGRIALASAMVEPAMADEKPVVEVRTYNWMGCLRAFNAGEDVVTLELETGDHVQGRIAVVALDHVRVIQHERDEGALGPVVPLSAITCLWLSRSSHY